MRLSSRWRRTSAVSAIMLTAGLTGGLLLATSASAATSCQVTYAKAWDNGGGFGANLTLKNTGDPWTSWTLTFAFAGNQHVDQGWSADWSQIGPNVTAKSLSWSGTVPTNGTLGIGFNGSYSGTNANPTAFAVNGVACGGTTPSPSASASRTASPSPSPSASRSVSPSPSPSRSVSPSPSSSSQPPGNAQAVVAAMQPGWNLGNSLDATGADETSWGNPRVTAALLDNIRAQGFNSIRIPVTWGQYQGGAPGYTINATHMNRVKEIVDWALADGFYVMINIHHDSWQWINNMPGDRTNVLARYNATWTQIAATFRNSSNKLVFESVNEPTFTGSSGDAQNATLLHELNTSFRTIVRQSGGNNATRYLVLPTLHTSADQVRIDELVTTFNSLNDTYLIATVHFYGYWPFSVNVAGGTRFDANVQTDLTGVFDRVYNAFTTRGIPVIIGEYGLLGFDRHTGTIQQGEKLKFFEFLGHYARSRQITTMLWDNGQHFGRNSFQWADPELFAQIKSSWTTRSGTASSDQVYNAKATAITSKTLTLNLNGTSFVSLRQGSTDLVRGTDYTVTGDQLTLTATALTRLTGARAYGVNATLSARFSTGVPWRIDILTYDKPTVQNATGTTSAFSIPTTFKGDQLATMEAKYADGTNAGPHNWTSFKEFDVAFSPNYTGNAINLTTAFFAEVNNAAKVTLTLHFWSGTTVTYYVTKSGTAITGSTT